MIRRLNTSRLHPKT